MKILLDENFPLQLYWPLRFSGYEVEHTIMLGQRGIPDSAIRERMSKEEIVFLTQDSEFEKMPGGHRGIVLISRIRQSLPIQKRTEICRINVLVHVNGVTHLLRPDLRINIQFL